MRIMGHLSASINHSFFIWLDYSFYNEVKYKIKTSRLSSNRVNITHLNIRENVSYVFHSGNSTDSQEHYALSNIIYGVW